MSDDTPSPLNNVITIDDERIKSHLDRVVRGTVEETLNALLDAEADRLCAMRNAMSAAPRVAIAAPTTTSAACRPRPVRCG
jgi:putative transposase